jgi:hypothetical protein
MKEIEQIRLDILIKNFRDVPNVTRAYKKLSKYIKDDNDKKLKKYLRNHLVKPIETDREIEFRDDTDFLLGFYGLVQVGLIADYLPYNLNPKLISEIELILENKRVKEYYENFYRLYLPQLLLNHVTNISKGIRTTYGIRRYMKNAQGVSLLFEKLVVLYRLRINDSDIDQFLWLLDDGETPDWKKHGYVRMEDLLRVLYHPREKAKLLKFNQKLSKEDKELSPLEQAIYGFAKYLNWLNSFHSFLDECENMPLFQSACWHLESYWFDHFQDYISEDLKTAIKNLQITLSRTYQPTPEFVLEKDTKAKHIILEDWKKESAASVSQALKDINYLFNREHGKLVRDMVKKVNKKQKRSR